MSQRQLDNIAVTNDMWAEAAGEMLANGWSLEEQADHYALNLARSVVNGIIEVENLREEKKALNDLDAQAVDEADGNIEDFKDDDFKEAMARRVGHHATKKALKCVRTERSKTIFRGKLKRIEDIIKQQRGSGMGRLESHDVSLDLVLRARPKLVE